jgi:hypothetical protein
MVWRVANWIFRICLLDEAARGENTAFVINRGVIRRGCRTLSERKSALFFASDAKKPETPARNGRFALHFGARPPSGQHVPLLRTPAALVKHPRDWPWSSRPYYAKGENGPRRIDPADLGLVWTKEKVKDPPFQKAKTKGWSTPERKDKIKTVSGRLATATRR